MLGCRLSRAAAVTPSTGSPCVAGFLTRERFLMRYSFLCWALGACRTILFLRFTACFGIGFSSLEILRNLDP
jgi:hypothetical protein